jgi:hypothetical protein
MPLAGADGSSLLPFGEGSYCVTVQHPLGCIAEQQCEQVLDVENETTEFYVNVIALSDGGYTLMSSDPLAYCRVYDLAGRIILEPSCYGRSALSISEGISPGTYFVECASISSQKKTMVKLRLVD